MQMKNLTSIVGQHKFSVGLAALALMIGTANVARADAIEYPNVGTLNPVIYTFTATSSGNITAYFAGADAGYNTVIGMLVNGVSTGITGLNDQTSTVGQSLILGSVNAGDVLTFELINNSPINPREGNNTTGLIAYSNPTLNATYDSSIGSPTVGHNHVYSTAYTRTSDIIGFNNGVADPLLYIPLSANIPVGTFVAFEDIPIPGDATSFPDYDYNDETFIFTDVTTTTGVPDASSSLTLLGIGFAGVSLLRRRLCA
jgi:VPDSG-CTERM motif